MFQAYVAIGSKKHIELVDANPYTMVISNQNLYLQEVNKEEADGLLFFMLEELTPKEIYLFKDSITVVGVNDVIRLRKKTLTK